ncbi:MAG TPA: HAD family hydrolase [Isosphaeraceae bacterium]|jgi:putative hydrolase of the HAD superfamily|nr:HAD family hydrolase [Isosphaeraceae bacterium]
MSDVPTLFFDIGGVVLSNAWDTAARRRAAEAFGLDFQEFQTRHEMLKTAFETGRLTLVGYVQKAVFYRPRNFAPEEFTAFMFSESKPIPETLDWLRTLAATRKYRLFTLNNESRELHEYRVRAFRLDEVFECFFTSCYLGQAKPDEGIYLNALGIAGCHKDRAVFIDDRSLNVEPAEALGLTAVQFSGVEPLRAFLKEHGVES